VSKSSQISNDIVIIDYSNQDERLEYFYIQLSRHLFLSTFLYFITGVRHFIVWKVDEDVLSFHPCERYRKIQYFILSNNLLNCSRLQNTEIQLIILINQRSFYLASRFSLKTFVSNDAFFSIHTLSALSSDVLFFELYKLFLSMVIYTTCALVTLGRPSSELLGFLYIYIYIYIYIQLTFQTESK
jgi:hypothetical protein